jgi:hypothetical protein
MNYSLFIMVIKEMVPMEVKRQPGAAQAASPLLSLHFVEPFHVFSISIPPHHEIN